MGTHVMNSTFPGVEPVPVEEEEVELYAAGRTVIKGKPSSIPKFGSLADPQLVVPEQPKPVVQQQELTGGRTNYYLVRVEHPQREEQPPYQAECEDIIDALNLTFDEANIFKEIWRSANARQMNGKPGHSALYGAQKIVHYAKRILRKYTLPGTGK